MSKHENPYAPRSIDLAKTYSLDDDFSRLIAEQELEAFYKWKAQYQEFWKELLDRKKIVLIEMIARLLFTNKRYEQALAEREIDIVQHFRVQDEEFLAHQIKNNQDRHKTSTKFDKKLEKVIRKYPLEHGKKPKILIDDLVKELRKMPFVAKKKYTYQGFKRKVSMIVARIRAEQKAQNRR